MRWFNYRITCIYPGRPSDLAFFPELIRRKICSSASALAVLSGDESTGDQRISSRIVGLDSCKQGFAPSGLLERGHMFGSAFYEDPHRNGTRRSEMGKFISFMWLRERAVKSVRDPAIGMANVGYQEFVKVNPADPARTEDIGMMLELKRPISQLVKVPAKRWAQWDCLGRLERKHSRD